jgi:hypothetical protein
MTDATHSQAVHPSSQPSFPKSTVSSYIPDLHLFALGIKIFLQASCMSTECLSYGRQGRMMRIHICCNPQTGYIKSINGLVVRLAVAICGWQVGVE